MAGYIKYLTDMCAKTEIMARISENAVKAFDYTDIKKQESKQKALTYELYRMHSELFSMLSKEFLPPIEREDICLLSQCVINAAEKTSDILTNIILFDIKHIKKEMANISRIIVNMAECATKMAANIKSKDGSIQLLSGKMKKLFNDAKEENSHAAAGLFEKKGDALYITVMLKIYSVFISCAQSFLKFSQNAETTALKNI